MVYVCLPICVFSQGNWGYAAASFKVPADSGFVEVLFISNVMNLSALSGRTTSRGAIDQEKRPQDELYASRMREWFYKRIEETNNNALALIEKDNIYADIELYPNASEALNKKLKNNLKELPTTFLNKKMARIKRDNFMTLAQHNKSIIVEIE